MDKWDNLDSAAEANLGAVDLRKYHELKEELKDEGCEWTDAVEMLRGLIWDASEEVFVCDIDGSVGSGLEIEKDNRKDFE